MKRIKVFCLDDGSMYTFLARTAYEALDKMRYYLNLKGKDEAVINKTEGGRVLWFEHSGKTYSATV